jgi:Family of unknown function (DUF6790)
LPEPRSALRNASRGVDSQQHAWGILGFLCIWIGGLFWFATGLGWSFFMLGATYGHIRETVIRGDYAPYNFFTMFSDGFIGIWILVLLYLYWRQGGFRK